MVVWIGKQYVSITFNNSKEKQMSVRDEYVKKMHSRLDQLNHEIDKLAASKDQIGKKVTPSLPNTWMSYALAVMKQKFI